MKKKLALYALIGPIATVGVALHLILKKIK
jgi:hypothetical protein